MWRLANKTLRLKTLLIRIHIISQIHRMLILVVAPTTLQSQLAMGFTLPLTRLAFKHLRPLSCQRLGPPTTHTTWVNTLYVKLTDSLECQDAILTKLYNEAPPRTSWNYVLSMRHHHELPLIGVMELRPDHETPPRNHRGIMSWPMRHHHEISPRASWNYVLSNEAPPCNHRGITSWPHQNHVSPTNIKSLYIPIPYHIYT